MRISDWSSDVCSSDLEGRCADAIAPRRIGGGGRRGPVPDGFAGGAVAGLRPQQYRRAPSGTDRLRPRPNLRRPALFQRGRAAGDRSEEHTSELQSLMRISYAVFCLKKKKTKNKQQITTTDRHP